MRFREDRTVLETGGEAPLSIRTGTARMGGVRKRPETSSGRSRRDFTYGRCAPSFTMGDRGALEGHVVRDAISRATCNFDLGLNASRTGSRAVHH